MLDSRVRGEFCGIWSGFWRDARLERREKYQWRSGGVSMKLRRSILSDTKPVCVAARIKHVFIPSCACERERDAAFTGLLLRWDLWLAAGSEPWSGSVLRFCVRVFAEDGRFKRVHAEEGLGKTRSYYRWVSARATHMKIYHGNHSFRQKTIVTTVKGFLCVDMVHLLRCFIAIFVQ